MVHLLGISYTHRPASPAMPALAKTSYSTSTTSKPDKLKVSEFRDTRLRMNTTTFFTFFHVVRVIIPSSVLGCGSNRRRGTSDSHRLRERCGGHRYRRHCFRLCAVS